MNIIINTKYCYSEKIINSLFNFDASIKLYIFQMDCLSKNAINKIDIMDNDDYDLFNKIKHFFESYIEDNANVKSNMAIFNKLCLLYFKGGIIVNENILIKNIEEMIDLYKTNDICVIKSCVSNKIFDGIIIAKERNIVLLEVINMFLNDPTTDINEILLGNVTKSSNCKLLNEQIILDKSNIYGKQNEIIAEHYFKNDFILEKIKIKKNLINDLSKIKIGITIHVPENLKDFYSNGIKQNCLYLYELLKNAGYNVKLITDSDKNISVLKEIDFYNFEFVTINDIFSYDFDVVFSMGFSINQLMIT